jgi:hypothetical protein
LDNRCLPHQPASFSWTASYQNAISVYKIKQDRSLNFYSTLQHLTAFDSWNLKKSFSDGIFWTKTFLSTTLRQIFRSEGPVPGKEG